MLMTYMLWAVSLILATANGCLLHKFANRDMKGSGDVFFFNGGISLVWIAAFSLLSIVSGDLKLSPTSIAYGCCYGAVICMFLLTKNLALACGPVSLTTLIGSCPFILTTLFGVLFMKQSINAYQIIGIAMIVLSLFLCVKPGKGEKRYSAQWILYAVIYFFAGGFVGIIYMLFGASNASTEINGMMLCASVVAALLYYIVGYGLSHKNKERPNLCKKSWFSYMLLCGIASCGYMRLNLYLSIVIPSVVFFPVANGVLVILSTVTSMLFFKERLTRQQVIGMILGLIAIVITGSGSALAKILLEIFA